MNVQKYYASQLREKRAATTQSNPRDEVPVTSQVPAQAAQTTADGHFAAQLQATLRNLQQAKFKNDAASRNRSTTQVKTEQSSEKRSPLGRTPPGGSDPQEVLTLVGAQLPISTADHSQPDRQTERVKRVLVDALKSCAHSFLHWSDCLPMAGFAINKSVHASTGHTPL
ncbi:hypothetical protein PR003_g15966 [Phytophthora rubi]|uniref:Integrase catalytic domain-containing protein n=1 Tax=Phytophthora rubi TaxID=129364 RepID=A0A6A4F3N3_9STRA|nr:hypothetical protein PR003_g15966 [Phytophthora rubi]